MTDIGIIQAAINCNYQFVWYVCISSIHS